MIKIQSRRYKKIWGEELWLYSPLKGFETPLITGQILTKGPLIKIIKTNQPLSIQVHPNNEWAKRLEKAPNGKSEAWFVLASSKDSQLVLGLKNYDIDKNRLMVENKTFVENLSYIKPQVGKFYDIPAGLVHGIGANMTILEVQQPSDITYRYYDYDRLENGQLRSLHLEKALQVQQNLNWEISPISNNPLIWKNALGWQIVSRKAYKLEFEAIVINLTSYEAYFAHKDEIIAWDFFAIISL